MKRLEAKVDDLTELVTLFLEEFGTAKRATEKLKSDPLKRVKGINRADDFYPSHPPVPYQIGPETDDRPPLIRGMKPGEMRELPDTALLNSSEIISSLINDEPENVIPIKKKMAYEQVKEAMGIVDEEDLVALNSRIQSLTNNLVASASRRFLRG